VSFERWQNDNKMRDHKGCKRAYIRSSKAFYAKTLPTETIKVMVGMYHPEGGTSGEFEFEWVDLGSSGLCVRLKCFDDAWDALAQFKDLLRKMAEIDEQNIQESEFCKILDKLGIIDITEYEQGVLANSL
jgi:hypothetical protein